MEKLLIKLTTIIFVSAILVNPVTSSTTQSNTTGTEQSTAAQNSVQSTTTTTQSITTTLQSTTTTTQSTTITTQLPTTTQPIIPVNISGNCNDSSQCKAFDENTECNNNICECKEHYFEWNATYCAEVNYLNPSSLRLNSTETNITAAWTGPSYLPPQYHIVYYVEINGDKYYNNTTTGANETEFGGLTAGKIYTVFVISVVNETIWSDKINGTQWTRPYPPDCPPNKYNYTAPNITVSWEKPSGEVDGYNIHFNGTSHNNLTSLTLDFYNTEPGVNYTMTLQSFVGNDHMSAKAICYIRTESGEPDPPRNATLDDAPAQNNFSILVEEPDSSKGDIVSYKFILYSKNYIDQEYMFDKNEIKSVTSDNIYLISGLTPGTYYFVQVFTVNDAFTSETSFNISRDIRTEEDKPGKVEHLISTSSKKSVNVSWMRPDKPKGDIIGYRILITGNDECRAYIQENSSHAINSSCESANRTTINLNQNSMSQDIMNLKASTEYSVEVYAYTAVGVGEKSVINVETNSAPPFKPTKISGTALDSTSIKVNWQSPTERTGPTTYKVTVYDVILEQNSSETCKSEGFNTTHCTVNNLKEYWLYTFQVTAVVKNGDTIVGRNSSGISSNVTTAEGVPGKVEQFTHSLENSGCRASLRWFTPVRENRNGLITSYQITISGSTKSYEDKDPQPYDPGTKSFEYPVVLKKGSIINVQIMAKNSKKENSLPSYLKINTQDCFEPLSGGEVVGIVVCVLLLLAAIVLAGVIVYRKWDIISKYVICGGDDERFEPLQPSIEQNRPIVLNSIKALLAKYHADDNRLFIAEYEDLRTLQPRHPTNTAILDENKPKNRYTNILAYDHSRVILSPTEDEDSSDYINANYIPGYTYGKEFIASQGPLPGTTNDFWRMIWEQSVSVIVMLTECSEKNMDKCEHYWPYQANEPKCYDDLMVNITSKSNLGKYDITIMDLCLGDEKRVIKHFHFLEWPDFSARVETTTLIDFISTVRSHITPDIKGPTVTHCSAGVGRTGTFITVDYLMQYVRDNDLNSEVDIFDFVLQMREYRTTMVQTHTQYAFIHECLSDIVERKKKSLQRDSELEMVNLAFEDDLYENTKMEVMQEKTEL